MLPEHSISCVHYPHNAAHSSIMNIFFIETVLRLIKIATLKFLSHTDLHFLRESKTEAQKNNDGHFNRQIYWSFEKLWFFVCLFVFFLRHFIKAAENFDSLHSREWS